MMKLMVWILLISIIKNSHQTCSSTVAITTCTWDTIKPSKPIQITDYKTYLSFSRGNLEHIPTGTFRLLPQVTILQLSQNKIKNLEEDSFLGLQDLQVLNLYDNQVRSIEKNVFKHCPKLVKLDLGMNKLDSITNKAFDDLANLQILNLGFNSLKVVPPAVNSLPTLEILMLNNNLIEKLKGNDLFNLKKLEKLIINDNKIRNVENDAFKGLRNLKQLDLRSNYLTTFDVDALVKNTNNLTSISLSLNDFSCNVLSQIVEKFRRYKVDVTQGVSRSSNTVNGIGCKK